MKKVRNKIAAKKKKKGVKKQGGFLPLLALLGPLIAGVGGLAGGAAGIATAVKKAQNDAAILAEMVRHNKKMEGAGMKKKKKKVSRRGKGLYLKPPKT